jgi:hypothetical protein
MQFSKKSQMIVLLGVIAVVAILLMTPWGGNILTLGGNDYGTGVPISTVTMVDTVNKGPTGEYKNQPFIQQPATRPEIYTHDKYICSWLPKEYSQLITMRCNFDYRNLWSGMVIAQDAVYISRYYVTVDYVDAVTKTKTKIIDTSKGTEPGKAWNTDYVEMDTNRWIETKKNYAVDSKGVGALFFPSPVGYVVGMPRMGINDDPIKKWINVDATYNNWHTFSTETLEFHIKGMRMGALETNYYIEWAERIDGGLLQGWHFDYKGFTHLAKDSCYLASGEGDIHVLSTGMISNEGTARETLEGSQGTQVGDLYTKFVFEEGSTIDIRVDTGYSGTALNPGEDGYGAGWTVLIYNGKGEAIATYDNIPDGREGYPLASHPKGAFKIPTRSFVPGRHDLNTWKVVLKNTLFKQAETELFVVDSLKKIPFKTNIILDKAKYVEGDTVHVTLTANANPNGTGEITQFYVVAKYGGSTSTYAVDGFPRYYAAIKKSNLIYTASFSFVLQSKRPVTLETLYIRAHAIDKDTRTGIEGEIYPYIEQNATFPDGGGLLEGMDYTLLLIVVVIIAAAGIGSYILLSRKKGGSTFKFRRKKK